MLKNITPALLLSFLVTTSIHAEYASTDEQFKPELTNQMLEQYGAGFTGLEHKNLGDSVRLHLNYNGPVKLTLPNGIRLSYGEIVMFAGDMFGNPAKPVSDCKETDRLSCFKAQFEALGVKGNPEDQRCANPLNQVVKLGNYMTGIENELKQARDAGVTDWDFYLQHDVDITKKMNELTCGGSFISSFIPFGTYIKLAQVNYDHFAPDSLNAYKAGHQYALETAIEAYKKRKSGHHKHALKLLELAYAQNAFANHYLTDSFSAGHMRVPRRAIAQDIMLPAVLNLLIANLMHNEDNKNGLNVVNAEGTSWVAYGDGYLYKPEAQMQRAVMLDAMQRSADGVYEAYRKGRMPEHFSEMDLFPDYSKVEQLNQSAALFKVENGVLLKRVNNRDPYDANWTQHWSGLITLIEFQTQK
ncbi:MAG: phospholipase [Legionella sp.]|nr:phospholipase [Legionella sp.]